MVSSGIFVDAILVYQSASSELTLTSSQRNDGQISCLNFIGISLYLFIGISLYAQHAFGTMPSTE